MQLVLYGITATPFPSCLDSAPAGLLSALSCSQDQRARGPGSKGVLFARGGCYLRSTPAAPISTVEGGLVSQQGPGHHRRFGFCLFFLLGLARRGSGKAAGRLEHLPTSLHLQPFWAPKVRSPTLRGLTRGRSPGDTLTLSWD